MAFAMLPLFASMMATTQAETATRTAVSGFYGGNAEYTPKRGKFKGYMREYRRSQFKRTHQKR